MSTLPDRAAPGGWQQAAVLVVGAGGLGCPALYALARAGVGTLGVADPDRVDVTNLHRQILHASADVGRLKVESAAAALVARFPDLRVRTHALRVETANAAALISQYQVVVDGTDSFDSKFLLNDSCVLGGVPLVIGAVVGLGGQLMSVLPGHACYRCLFEAPPEAGAIASCQQAGVLGPVAGVIGALQAKEALAILAGAPELASALLAYEARSDRRRVVRFRPRRSCAACGESRALDAAGSPTSPHEDAAC